MDKVTLKPSTSQKFTDIYFDLSAIADACSTKQGVLFVDETISKTHAPIIQKLLGYELIVIPSGEKSKSREMKQKLENELMQRKIGKNSTFVAMGGGVVSDLVGFIASTYMRGVNLVLMPTTLLAMVDAAIGGKTGVNTPFGKNLIGSFYLPKAILIDSDFLKSLPEVEMKNGLSEILKYGLVLNLSIWERCVDWEKNLPFLIQESVRCKVDIVTQDFEESVGIRRILNFGHTVGHALEFLSNFSMPHGEAVALGCMAESFLSFHKGHLSREVLDEILKLYRNLGYAFKDFESDLFLKAMQMDKKAEDGLARFVMIDQIGHAIPFNGKYCTAVEDNDLNELIKWMKNG